jgi:hypothetical protein
MHLKRLRRGELIALLGALGLLVTMFLDWFAPHAAATLSGFHETGWTALGWFAAGIVAIAILLTLLWLFATVTQQSTALPVAGGVVTIAVGGITAIAVLSRLVFQPGLGVGLGNAAVDLQAPAYIGALLAILIPVGAWQAIADERTEAPYSQPGEIELRAIPE